MRMLLCVFACVWTPASLRDYYVGMFKRNDYLVAQDTVYAQRRPHAYAVAKYGRQFTCPITYFRVVDRLGVCRGPGVQVIRGGLRHKYLVLKVTSCYNRPISANVYVGCTSERSAPRPPPPPSDEQDTTEDNISDEQPPALNHTTPPQHDAHTTTHAHNDTHTDAHNTTLEHHNTTDTTHTHENSTEPAHGHDNGTHTETNHTKFR